MNKQTLIITASVALLALIGVGSFLAMQRAATEVVVEVEPSPAVALIERKEIEEIPAIPAKPEPTLAVEVATTMPDEIPEKVETTSISPTTLKQAEMALNLMRLEMAKENSAIMKMLTINPTEDVDVLVKKLSLRLALTEEQAQAFNQIIANHSAASSSKEGKALIQGLLQMDPKVATEFAALQSMQKNGPLPPELESHSQSIKQQVADTLGIDFDDPNLGKPTPWDRDQKVLDALSTHLTPAQQDELNDYAMEQVIREEEKAAYDRSTQLAKQLGLNEEDRSALNTYLRENPGATQEDIGEILSPELVDLL